MTATPGIRFQPASDRSLLVYVGASITMESHRRVRALLHLLEQEPIPGVRNLHPAYCSLLITFDPVTLDHEALEAALAAYVARVDGVRFPPSRQVDIPVCYGGEFGPDLEELADLRGLTVAQAIELHASADYTVYFIGFVPGFAYLGGLPDALATPRLATPRRVVAPGSVAIGSNQTGVYPVASPGGWRVIGRTPMTMFSPDREPMSLLSIGDRVHFVPVSNDRFEELARA